MFRSRCCLGRVRRVLQTSSKAGDENLGFVMVDRKKDPPRMFKKARLSRGVDLPETPGPKPVVEELDTYLMSVDEILAASEDGPVGRVSGAPAGPKIDEKKVAYQKEVLERQKRKWAERLPRMHQVPLWKSSKKVLEVVQDILHFQKDLTFVTEQQVALCFQYLSKKNLFESEQAESLRQFILDVTPRYSRRFLDTIFTTHRKHASAHTNPTVTDIDEINRKKEVKEGTAQVKEGVRMMKENAKSIGVLSFKLRLETNIVEKEKVLEMKDKIK
eukprot:Platyproteum_vivax@DN8940_c0_g1_i1.p1